jgi:hypothetical protein
MENGGKDSPESALRPQMLETQTAMDSRGRNRSVNGDRGSSERNHHLHGQPGRPVGLLSSGAHSERHQGAQSDSCTSLTELLHKMQLWLGGLVILARPRAD